MNTAFRKPTRRNFIAKTITAVTGFTGLTLFPQIGMSREFTQDDEINILGPKQGYSPQIGTLVSMMTWMRSVVLMSVEKLKQADLDFLFDANSNTIGALLMHLAATETFYQLNTFEGFTGRTMNDDFKNKWSKWNTAMNLGEGARKSIKGNELKYYTDILAEVREKTLTEFRKRDDEWLMQIDPKFFGGKPTNNYCKWFHVCEHESNHNGQIKWLVKRIPGAKAGGD
ncbi:MAG TPA: DinB family protein [Puia sp.]|nr:DinB family protein [Puia sp.]